MGTVSGGRRRAFRSRHHTPMGQGGKLAVIFVSVALVLFVVAVMLGNYLRGLAQDILDNADSDETTESQVYYANTPADMIGRSVVFGVDYSSISETTDAETAEETGYVPDPIRFDAVSTLLRRKDRESGEMVLSYASPIAGNYGNDVTGDIELSAGLALISSNWGERTRVCAVFEVDYLNAPEETRGIARAYEVALICELVQAGFDEVLLLGFSDNTDEGLSFISDVYEQKGRKTAVGLALSFDCINAPDAEEKLRAVSSKCGFLALDLYSIQVPVLMSPESLISDRVGRTGFICHEFSIRVLLGCGDAPDCELQTRAAMSAGSRNMMSIE